MKKVFTVGGHALVALLTTAIGLATAGAFGNKWVVAGGLATTAIGMVYQASTGQVLTSVGTTADVQAAQAAIAAGQAIKAAVKGPQQLVNQVPATTAVVAGQ